MFRIVGFLLIFFSHRHMGGNITTLIDVDKDVKIFNFIADIAKINYKTNGLKTIICIGWYPNEFYSKLEDFGPILTNNVESDNYEMDNVVSHSANTIIMNSANLEDFENVFMRAIDSPYWHPHANLIVYYENEMNAETIGHMFYILWYQKCCNAIIVQCDGNSSFCQIAEYSPFVSENNKFQYNMGCYMVKKIGLPIHSMIQDLKCEENCNNVTITSKLRGNNLGTCIGFNYHNVRLGDTQRIWTMNLFEDKATNLHGYVFRLNTVEILPFMKIQKSGNGSYTLHQRDGMIWNAMSEKMNFQLDFSPSEKVLKNKFDFELSIQQIFAFSNRKVDLYLNPIYLIDLIIMELDLTYPFKDSGVCFISHRADFETILFDVKIIEENVVLVLQFGICFLGVWFTFFIFNRAESDRVTLDQIGKDFTNTIRNILSINLHRPPRNSRFRIFLTISIWSFFLINFSMQAAIISFFSASIRGKEVETFDDIVEKGYIVEGMATPDVVLPDTEERFMKINSKLKPAHDMFDCISKMVNDSHRFCLIDCSVGRFLERNKLNYKGEQYLHIARDRVHSHYLTMILIKHSPLTSQFNKHMLSMVEAGLIKKWEEYRFNDLKEDGVAKSLTMEDLMGVFKCYLFLIIISLFVFFLEITTGLLEWVKINCCVKLKQLKSIYYERKLQNAIANRKGKRKLVHMSTQTVP